MGIGIVVPAHKILEALNHPELIRLRKQADEEKRWQEMPKPDKST
jgi:hypothetical protein